jgi:hypothetical protein
MRPEFFGENCTAKMLSPCPDTAAEHLETAFTLNTACGAYCSTISVSADAFPGFTNAL